LLVRLISLHAKSEKDIPRRATSLQEVASDACLVVAMAFLFGSTRVLLTAQFTRLARHEPRFCPELPPCRLDGTGQLPTLISGNDGILSGNAGFGPLPVDVRVFGAKRTWRRDPAPPVFGPKRT
jgi:hypothetical protein